MSGQVIITVMRQKKNKTRIVILVFWLIILSLYLFTRLYNLTLLPIFFDEANFIYWAKKIAETNDHLFISLSGGKNILLPWLMAVMLKVLPDSEYLAAGRLVSVGGGFVSLLAIYKIALLIFKSRQTAYLAALLYIFSPLALFYDRMALYDSLLTAALTWAVYFFLKSCQKPLAINILMWGVFIGLGFLTKATTLFYAILTPLMFIFLQTELNWRKSLKIIIFYFLISQIVANLIGVSRGYGEYLTKALAHTPAAQVLILNPLALLVHNLFLTVEWLSAYQSPIVVVLAVMALLYLYRTNRRAFSIFSVLLFVPIIAMAFLGREYFSRYLLFCLPYLYLALAWFLIRYFKFGITIFVLTLQIYLSLLIVTSPEKAALPAMDKWQYVSGFPSGYGLPEVFTFLKQNTKASPRVTFVVQGSYSHYPNAFILEFWDDKRITIIERWPFKALDPEITSLAKKTDLYLILRDEEIIGNVKPLEDLKGKIRILFTAKKPGGKDSVYVAKLL